MNIFFDIETVSAGERIPAVLLDHILEKVKPDGRIKDAGKITADIIEKRAKLASEFGLSPLTGKIVSVSWAINNETIHSMTSYSEKDIVTSIADVFSNFGHYDKVIGFNLASFDLPFTIVRAALYGYRLPQLSIGKYNKEQMCDMMLYLSPDKMVSQTDYAILFGILDKYPDIDGSNVQELYDQNRLDLIEEHNKEDIRVLRELYRLTHYDTENVPEPPPLDEVFGQI